MTDNPLEMAVRTFNRYHIGLLGGLMLLPAALPAVSQPAHQLILISDAITNGKPIPPSFTCDGSNSSPPLNWGNVPRNAKSLALTVDDPDAPGGDFVHWVVYDIPTHALGLLANTPAQPRLPDGSVQGRNGAGKIAYTGPCPPSGTHRYFFRLYALNNKPSLPPGATMAQLQQAMRGHVIAQAQLMGTYARQR